MPTSKQRTPCFDPEPKAGAGKSVCTGFCEKSALSRLKEGRTPASCGRAIIGKEGFFIKRFCKKLLDYDLIDLIGSDAHNLTDRPPRLGACAEYLEKKMGAAYVTQLMIKNPIHYLKLE